MTEYIADQLVGDWGNPTGPPLSETQPTLGGNESADFTWRGNFTDPNIVGFKLVGEFSGSGVVYWDWYFDDPNASPWPEPDHTDWNFVGLNNSSFFDPAGWEISGSHQVREYVFAVTDTAADPAYGGFGIAAPLADLLISLNANEGTGHPYDHVYGSVRVGEGGSVQVHRLDLIVYTEGESTGCANPYRVYQESDANQGGIWGDDSDATYTEQWGDGGPFDGFPNYSGGLIYPYTDDPTQVRGIQVTVRASATRTDGSPDPVMVQYDLYSNSASSPTAGSGSVDVGTSSQDFPITADGVIRDYIWPLSAEAVAANSYGADKPYPGDFTFADIAWMMTQPTPAIEFYFDSWGGTPFDPINRVVRIYQVRVCLLAARPVIRQYPSTSPTAWGGGPRQYPAPTRRPFGGFQ